MPESRILAVSAFLDSYKCGSSLDDFNTATEFVNEADKNGIDYRILPAIWIMESSCGKHQLVQNGFGFMKAGGQAAGLRPFNSTDDAISYISHALTMPPYASKSLPDVILTYNHSYTYLEEFTRLTGEISDYNQLVEKLQTNCLTAGN